MRLEAIDLIAYGPFTRQHLEFPNAFTIVFGLNEAGKTSALRAIADGLYGIPLQTSDDFIHPYRDLRIGLALSDGAHRFEFIRRKANVQSLRGLDDAIAVEDGELERFLQGLSRADFETMFGISHERLVQGGRDIAAGKGEVGQILFAAAAGLIGLQTTLDRLEQQAGELYAPRPAANRFTSSCGRSRRRHPSYGRNRSAWQYSRRTGKRWTTWPGGSPPAIPESRKPGGSPSV
jgi:uncharacterized protein YhaN